MREILFRGKDVNSSEWRVGYFYTAVQGSVAMIGDGDDAYQVKPETVGQYTGLKDKNGRRIFEGDIVVYNTLVNERFRVEYWISGAYIIKGNDDRRFFLGVLNCVLAVIGNIFDNPERYGGESGTGCESSGNGEACESCEAGGKADEKEEEREGKV